MTPSPVGMRLALLVLLTLSVGARAFGAERETGPNAAAAAAALAAMVPAPTVAFDASAGRLLPADAVLLATLAPPPAPAMAAAGAVLLQGGGLPPPQLRYYALDALGSVRVTFDAAGNVIGRADYEPFGAAVAASTTGTQPRQQFTGQERDGEVGVDYFGARLYLPSHGRMPSVDPLHLGAVGEPQRWNRYAYALNSPIVMLDPDGRTTTCTGTSRTPGSELGSCSGAANGGRPSSPPSGPVFSFGVSTFEFMGFSSNEAYFLSQYGYIPEFGSQTVAGPTSLNNGAASYTREEGQQAAPTNTTSGTPTGSAAPGSVPPKPDDIIHVGLDVSAWTWVSITFGGGGWYDMANGSFGLYFRWGAGIGTPLPTATLQGTVGRKKTLGGRWQPSPNFDLLGLGVSPEVGLKYGEVQAGTSVCANPLTAFVGCAGSTFNWVNTHTWQGGHGKP